MTNATAIIVLLNALDLSFEELCEVEAAVSILFSGKSPKDHPLGVIEYEKQLGLGE